MAQNALYRGLSTAALALAALVLNGCTAGVHLYPVSGPVAAQTPPQIYPARLSVNFATRSGAFTATLADGELFKGRWKLEVPGPVNKADVNDMSAIWDQVYGPGFYVAHVLGAPSCGKALVTGSKGTPLTIEICGAERGVARDGKGDVYKMTVDGVAAAANQ